MACSASGVRVRMRVYVDFQWAGPVWVLLRHPCACRRLAWAREESLAVPVLLLFASKGLVHPAAHSSTCQPDRLQNLAAGLLLCADVCVSMPPRLRAGLVVCVAV